MTNIMLTHVKISIEPGIREFYFLNIAKYLKIKNKINKKDRQEKKRQKKTKTKTNTKMPHARTVPQSNKKIVEKK
jgi:flagellar biosynthesis component FlhA